MPDYSNDQIKGFADYTMGNGGTWADITNAASQHGLSMNQVYGAGVKQPGVPDWMNGINATDPNANGGYSTYNDPGTGQQYYRNWTTSAGGGGEGGQNTTTQNGYTSTDGKPWYQGQQAYGYDANGNKTNQWEVSDPNKGAFSIGGKIALAAIAAMAGGAAYGGMTGGGASAGAGGGGTLAGDATLPGALGVDGLGAGGGATFNAAADSQLANAAIDAGGGSSLAGYGAAGATPATIDGLGSTVVAGASAGAGGGAAGTGGAGGLAGTGLTAGQIAGGAGTVGKIVGGGGGTSGNGFDLSSIIKLLGGGLDTANQNKASDDMLNYLKGQQDKIDKLYSPGSPEYNYLSQQLDRKDAAAGRNSQYGPRSTDLAARIAQIKADETVRMTQGVGNLYRNSLNQKAAAPTGLLSSLDSLSKGLGYSTSDISKWLSDNGLSKMFGSDGTRTNWTPDTTTTSNADNFNPDGGDIGQYL